jgi:hypothetical protein
MGSPTTAATAPPRSPGGAGFGADPELARAVAPSPFAPARAAAGAPIALAPHPARGQFVAGAVVATTLVWAISELGIEGRAWLDPSSVVGPISDAEELRSVLLGELSLSALEQALCLGLVAWLVLRAFPTRLNVTERAPKLVRAGTGFVLAAIVSLALDATLGWSISDRLALLRGQSVDGLATTLRGFALGIPFAIRIAEGLALRSAGRVLSGARR